MNKHSYIFDPGNRSILAEIFLPKRISLQGTLYNTLEAGLDFKKVKAYLVDKARDLQRDYLQAYQEWFDPHRYGYKNNFISRDSDAAGRMERCKRVFFGWSTYEISGVFLKDNMVDIDEEQTQVIRIIFKYEVADSLKDEESKKYPEVYRAILYWVVSTYGLNDGKPWNSAKCKMFLGRFPQWNAEQKKYAKKRFAELANDISIWIDDCGIFIFGFVLHQLWTEIVSINEEDRDWPEKEARRKREDPTYESPPRKRAHLEDQIWVTSIFRYDVNVSRSVPIENT